MTEDKVGGATVHVARAAAEHALPWDTANREEALVALGGLLLQVLSSADDDVRRTMGSNPLGKWIKPGMTILVKPNLVLHKNTGGGGLDCVVTSSLLVECVLDLVVKAQPQKVVVGDAPVQGCNWDALIKNSGYDIVIDRFMGAHPDIQWKDLRRNFNTAEDCVEVDLGTHSLLEAYAADAHKFRVTMYDPSRMRESHARGVHKYLLAKDAVDADVIINLPKLKCHKKAGITAAIKNLVGLNVCKDYLPHHRLGGSRSGGDCYEGANLAKAVAERWLDLANASRGGWRHAYGGLARLACAANRLLGGDRNIEGSWHGNDTVWRMCLDVNRAARYLAKSGCFSDVAQRRVLTIVDGVVCGEGDGPLAPSARIESTLMFGECAVAVDFVAAHLMGFDWRCIPIVREAFKQFRFPLTCVAPEEIDMKLNGVPLEKPWPPVFDRPFVPPAGWEIAQGGRRRKP